MSKVTAIYKTSRGMMAYDKKPIFQHNGEDLSNTISVGLVLIDQQEYFDKGRYAFASMKNVKSSVPDNYGTVDFFENFGVPHKVSRAIYGGSVLYKEEYRYKTFIKAYTREGTVLLQEGFSATRKTFNVNYMRLDNAVGEWKDITSSVHETVSKSIKNKKSDLEISTPFLLYVLNPIAKNGVFLSDKGLIFARGDHETLAIWGTGSKTSMVWMGFAYEYDGIVEDITSQVQGYLKEYNGK